MPGLRKSNKKSHAGLLSNYCGFGGSGPIQHKIDDLCMQHDNMYEKMLKEGRNPYTKFNEADQWMIDQIDKISFTRNGKTLSVFDANALKQHVLSRVIPAIWKVKRALAPNDVQEMEVDEFGNMEDDLKRSRGPSDIENTTQPKRPNSSQDTPDQKPSTQNPNMTTNKDKTTDKKNKTQRYSFTNLQTITHNGS